MKKKFDTTNEVNPSAKELWEMTNEVFVKANFNYVNNVGLELPVEWLEIFKSLSNRMTGVNPDSPMASERIKMAIDHFLKHLLTIIHHSLAYFIVESLYIAQHQQFAQHEPEIANRYLPIKGELDDLLLEAFNQHRKQTSIEFRKGGVPKGTKQMKKRKPILNGSELEGKVLDAIRALTREHDELYEPKWKDLAEKLDITTTTLRAWRTLIGKELEDLIRLAAK